MEDREARQVIIEREGSEITLTLRCADDYAAMLIYDDIMRQAKAGGIVLTFEVGKAVEAET